MVEYALVYYTRTSAAQIVFFHFKLNRIVELLFEILNRLE